MTFDDLGGPMESVQPSTTDPAVRVLSRTRSTPLAGVPDGCSPQAMKAAEVPPPAAAEFFLRERGRAPGCRPGPSPGPRRSSSHERTA